MIEIKSTFPVQGFLESKIGGRSENQDACSFQDTPLGLLVLVCDGMGGMNGGSTASSMAVHSIVSSLMAADSEDDPVTTIVNAVNNANAEIIQAGVENPTLAGMGTTLTLLLLTKRCAYTTYVGDSRIYQLRGNNKVYRSFDHSVVFQLVRQGVITEEQARLSSQSNVIMQALGVKETLDFMVEQLPYEAGDRFALCTDGFWGSMSEPQILTRLCSKKKVGNIVHESVLEIDGKGVAKGGHHDNLTIALLEVQSNSILKVKMSKTTKIILAALSAALVVSLALNIISPFRIPKDEDIETLSEKNDSLQNVVNAKVAKIKELRDTLDRYRQDNDKLKADNEKLDQKANNYKIRYDNLLEEAKKAGLRPDDKGKSEETPPAGK